MELRLTKEEVEEILKEHYRSPTHLEMGMFITDVTIYENPEEDGGFCSIILSKGEK